MNRALEYGGGVRRTQGVKSQGISYKKDPETGSTRKVCGGMRRERISSKRRLLSCVCTVHSYGTKLPQINPIIFTSSYIIHRLSSQAYLTSFTTKPQVQRPHCITRATKKKKITFQSRYVLLQYPPKLSLLPSCSYLFVKFFILSY